MRISTIGRRAAIAFGLAVALAGAAVPAAMAQDGKDRRVRILNDTRTEMREFYASRSSTNDWEEDILGRSTLPAGQSVVINIDDGTGACMFDFKAVFADGDVVVREDINVCEIEQYRFYGN